MNLPPRSYFNNIRSQSDYEQFNTGDAIIPSEWQSSFPQTFYEHRVMTKLYKHYQRKTKENKHGS